MPRILMADGDDRLPSITATDWVTYADHVVVVTAASERRLPISPTEAQRGEGLIGRTVTMKVLWSRKDAANPAPTSWTYNAAGFAFAKGDPAAVPMALHDRPRMEVGHQYILVIACPLLAPAKSPNRPVGWAAGRGPNSRTTTTSSAKARRRTASRSQPRHRPRPEASSPVTRPNTAWKKRWPGRTQPRRPPNSRPRPPARSRPSPSSRSPPPATSANATTCGVSSLSAAAQDQCAAAGAMSPLLVVGGLAAPRAEMLSQLPFRVPSVIVMAERTREPTGCEVLSVRRGLSGVGC